MEPDKVLDKEGRIGGGRKRNLQDSTFLFGPWFLWSDYKHEPRDPRKGKGVWTTGTLLRGTVRPERERYSDRSGAGTDTEAVDRPTVPSGFFAFLLPRTVYEKVYSVKEIQVEVNYWIPTFWT